MRGIIEVLGTLGLRGEVALSGSWITLRGERCTAYIAEAPRRVGYYVWCDDPSDRTVEHYLDASAAVEAALRRAAPRTSPPAIGST